ncbi:hypothetical protein FisN_14Hh381 [Fistulifera solaris]|uniref:Uncharacterized protein n=1 Tax=Fistulifera solaris TaxID=1519565 RepID=A0A1Z5K4J1_FISSO|nr:hypothetical protein FisN_14Hh381 [Fistulifera solaris]|eukprot:GAX21170.1 hypothetical protein FisN_14Hh381 [Fistulifera solaris]
MFLVSNSVATTTKKIGIEQKRRDEKIKSKIVNSKAKWSKDITYTDSESLRSGGSESLSITKRSASIKSGSPREESDGCERVTKEMRAKAYAIAFIEGQLDKYHADIETCTKRYEACKQIILARMQSRSAVGIILAINEYKKLLAKEATARRVVEQLESLLSEVVDCIELPGTIAQYKAKAKEIVEEAPVDPETLPLAGVTGKMVSDELAKLGIARN